MSVFVNAFRVVGKKAGSTAKKFGKDVAQQAKKEVFTSAKALETELVKASHKGQVLRVVVDGQVNFFRREAHQRLVPISLKDYEKAIAKHGKGKGADLLEKEMGKRLDVMAGDLKSVLKKEADKGKKKGRKAVDKLRKAIQDDKSPEKIAKKLKTFLEKRSEPKTIDKASLQTMVDDFTSAQGARKAYEHGAVASIDALQASRQLRKARQELLKALEKQEGGGRKPLYRPVIKALRQGKSEADVRAALTKALEGKDPKAKVTAEGLKKSLDAYFNAARASKSLTDVSAPAIPIEGAAGDLLKDIAQRVKDIWQVLVGKR